MNSLPTSNCFLYFQWLNWLKEWVCRGSITLLGWNEFHWKKCTSTRSYFKIPPPNQNKQPKSAEARSAPPKLVALSLLVQTDAQQNLKLIHLTNSEIKKSQQRWPDRRRNPNQVIVQIFHSDNEHQWLLFFQKIYNRGGGI